MPLVELRDVEKRFGQMTVLKGINFDINENEFMVIVGPSGSGKTTILRMIGGFVDPTRGNILLDGNSIAQVPVNRRPFNTVFQDYALFPHMTVRGNVGYGLRMKGVARTEVRRRVGNALDLVSLSSFGDRYPSQLSGGQRQRVALARALVCEPRLVLLDEPLAALDATLRRQMQGFLKDIQRDVKTSFLFITHDQEEAITLADRICVMDHGEIVQVGTAREIYYRPRNRYVAEFFGNNNLVNGVIKSSNGANYTIETAFGCFDAQGGGSQPSTGALLAVRPEAVEFSVVDPSRSAIVVSEIEFVGDMSVISLERVGGERAKLKAKALSKQFGMSVAVGDRVSVRWNSEDAWILPQ
jgi:spermidine/putrescine transport system ATP-binding protein